MSYHNMNEVVSGTEARHLRTVSAGECYPRYGDGVLTVEGSNGRVLMRQPIRDRHTQNGIMSSLARPKSEYISPAGISALDIRTRLRITEAELAIVQREVADLKVERNELETSNKQYEESWRFSVTLCGQIVEEKNELHKKYEHLDQTIKAARQHTPEMKPKKSKSSKSSVENLKLSLETQIRVAEVLEQERDRAFDDYEMAQAQLHTLIQQYQDLASSCSEVAREREKLKTEVQQLREELQRCEPESDMSSSRSSLKKMDSVSGSVNSLTSTSILRESSNDSDAEVSTDPKYLQQQLREASEEKEKAIAKYEQVMRKAEQYQKQLYRAEEDRRQALATSEALTSLWQKKFDKAQNENYDLRQELLTAHDRISLLQDHLAVTRIHSRGTTPLRPSPPDSIHSSDHALNHTSYTPTVTSEVNQGRFSPVKALSGSTSSSSNGGHLLSHQSSSGGSALSMTEGYKSRKEGEAPGNHTAGGTSKVSPHRTSSFHGFHKIDPHYSASNKMAPHNSAQHRAHARTAGHSIARTVSLKMHQELSPPTPVSPLQASSHQILGEHSDRRKKVSDADGSWI